MVGRTHEVVSSDGRSRVLPHRRVKKAASDRASLIVGFPGTGLVGSISANYIIDTMNMHQIASVHSEFVVPTVTYVGGRLRHPFRIYADSQSSLYVMVCEAPIMPEGIHSIMDLIVRWAADNDIGEVITLDGIPVRGLPDKNRKPAVLTSYLSSDSTKKKEGRHFTAALITGLSAGLLSACLSREMTCTAVLVPASSGIPDPEGAALLLEEISKMPSVPLDIDTGPLIKQGREIKHRLGQDMESMRRQSEKDRTSPYMNRSRIYG